MASPSTWCDRLEDDITISRIHYNPPLKGKQTRKKKVRRYPNLPGRISAVAAGQIKLIELAKELW